MALSDEDKSVINKLVADALTAAVGGEDFGKTLDGSVRRIVPGVVKSTLEKDLDAKLSPFAQFQKDAEEKLKKLTEVTPDDDKDPKNKKITPEMAKLQAELAELKKTADDAQKAAAAEREQAKRDKIRSAFTTAAAKVEGGFLGANQAFLLVQDRLQLGDDGIVKIKVKRESGGTKWEDEITVDDFLAKEFKNDPDGKIHYPAQPGGGSGGGAGGRQQEVKLPGGKLNPLQVNEILREAWNK